jgi:hypothetical protein
MLLLILIGKKQKKLLPLLLLLLHLLFHPLVLLVRECRAKKNIVQHAAISVVLLAQVFLPVRCCVTHVKLR